VRDERWHLRAVALPDGAEPADWQRDGAQVPALVAHRPFVPRAP